MDFDNARGFNPVFEDQASLATGWDRVQSVAVVDSQALLGGEREVLIRHADQTYRLRHTRNGKLILTK